MKTYRAFAEVALDAIRPEGWLRAYLETQARGLTGHIEVCGFPFDTRGWAASNVAHRAGLSWWPYEQTAYWVDGAIRCGRLIGDDKLVRKARKQIDYVLRHADRDGYLGPKFLKISGETDPQNRWPHAVFFRALMAEASAAHDRKIVEALRQHYLSNTAPHSKCRDVVNVEAMVWTYERTGDRRLLQHALDAYDRFNRIEPNSDSGLRFMRSNKRASDHGVTHNEQAKLAAILYMATGRNRLLDAVVNNYRKLDRDHMLIDGVVSSTEGLSGKDPLACHETCDIADYTWSVGYLLMATGNAEYADKIERACFNAAPAAVRADFRGLQYFSCPNQVIADRCSNHAPFFTGSARMSYRPNHDTPCCPGAVNRIIPNYAARMWMSDGAGGVVAALYGPSRITAAVGKSRRTVTILEETSYPFSERIDFQVRTGAPVRFGLTLRIPGWTRRARILINGRPRQGTLKPGSFVTISRTFRHGDRIALELPMRVRLNRWPGGGVAVERGPLVFALGISEDWRVDRADSKSSKQFPAWNLYPASAWNYALAVSKKGLADVDVVQRPAGLKPWTLAAAPILLHVPARRVRRWTLRHKRVIRERNEKPKRGQFRFTPPLPNPRTLPARLGRRVETITLVPYGCTHLRLTIFPNAAL